MANEILTTFLSAAKPIRKAFTPDGVTPYPLVKSFTSHRITYPATLAGMKARLKDQQRHAVHGNCLLRGNTTRDLKNESRSGQVDPLALNNTLVLDIDAIRIPRGDVLSIREMHRLARKIIRMLPAFFHDTSCICSASSSMGMKPGQVSMHLEFWLSTAKDPRWHKDLLRWLNLEIPLFDEQLELSATGTTFRWKLDAAMSSNAQIRYIAVPEFLGGVENPLPDIHARHFLVIGKNCLIDPSKIDLPKNVDQLVTRRVNAARATAGLPSKKENLAMIGREGSRIAVVTNPDHLEMTYVRDTDTFVYYNVNGGDSNAYYVKKYEPYIVHNFKGEPPFIFEAASPETYRQHLERWVFSEDPEGKKPVLPPVPIVFREPATDTYFNGFIEPGTGKAVDLYSVRSTKAMEDFMAQNGGTIPDPIPEIKLIFAPQENFRYDVTQRRLNTYYPPDLDLQILERFSWRNSPQHMMYHCPATTLLITHVLGGDTAAAMHFFNWLAIAYQLKIKHSTCWVWQGCQGTGKGILFSHVLAPLFGQQFCKSSTIEVLEEQYNGFLEDALLVMFDEFRLDTSKQADKLYNRVKNLISEKVLAIRHMYRGVAHRNVYFNCIFASNDRDVIRVPRDDRRMNVGSRQEVPLRNVVDVPTLLIDLGHEVSKFASALMAMDTDQSIAAVPFINNARAELQELSESTIDGFCIAIENGDLDYFLQVLLRDQGSIQDNILGAARTVMRDWLRRISFTATDEQEQFFCTIEELRILYSAILKPENSTVKFGRIMSLHGIKSFLRKHKGVTERGQYITWQDLDATRLQELRNRFMPETLRSVS